MKYYVDGEEVNLDQLGQCLEEMNNRDADAEDICWVVMLDYIKDGNLYFETMKYRWY